jgi:hypothetical protein
MDSTAPTAPRDSEIINEVLSQKTYGFDSKTSTKGVARQHAASAGDFLVHLFGSLGVAT